MRKNRMAILGLAVLTAVAMTGCGGSSSDTKPDSDKLEEKAEESKEEPKEEAEEPEEDTQDTISFGPGYAAAYLEVINSLDKNGEADSFALVDVDGDDIPELAAVDSAGDFGTDNAFLYTIKDDKAVLLKSVISGLDGTHLCFSEGKNTVYCTGGFSGSEHYDLYTIKDGTLEETGTFDLIYDMDKDSCTYKTDDKDATDEEYKKAFEASVTPGNPYTAIDCDGLNVLKFDVGEDNYIQIENISTEKYSDLAAITDKLGQPWTAETESSGTKQDTGASDGYKEAYRSVVSDFYNMHKDEVSEFANLGFGLIYFDGDDIPELVTGLEGYFVNMYTYDGKEVITILEDWGYGAGGNHGYDYLPKEGIIENINSDYAGAWVWDSYMKWDPDKREMVSLNPDGLCIRYVEDTNGNGDVDEEELENYNEDAPHYYYGDKEITEEEYNSYCHKGNYEALYGPMSYDEINKALSE